MSRSRLPTRIFVTLALALSVGLAAVASPFASSAPDGLERVAGDRGFLGEGRVAALQEEAPLADYAFPGVEDERLATGLAGFAGVLGVMGVGYGVAAVLRRRERTSSA